MAAFETVGDTLLLQVLFLLASLPMFTVVPAAVALQRALRKTVIEECPGVARFFLREFCWAWSRAGYVGLALPVAMAAAAFSILFWLATPGVAGVLALCVIIPICGIGAAAYVALLAVSMVAEDDVTGPELLRSTRGLMLAKSLPLAGCMVVLSTWLLLAFRLPTLIPLGSGLVPAFLAWLLVRQQMGARNSATG
ncbi:DUF624 domain-containing protein [Arthrobacter sp. B1I2]|uniref:DUF624 domain-containing protein n=1 Tax=Arthrobacter sp. B1I2 TaxID=3042263 RepID=UPI002789C1F3|nr:DUF624 domain-containing protein [Arthrobacter sp. B1I2]MDQ0732425.1 putative membrane protein YesL [Arthrobacter sp. B1I2]